MSSGKAFRTFLLPQTRHAQALYEKKLITYPRTDSQYLTEDMKVSLPDLIREVANSFTYIAGMAFAIHPEQVINNSKVSDHHAIIPTLTMARDKWSNIPMQERMLLELICNRLFCAVSDPYEYAETAVTLECEGYFFQTKGKTVTRIGWKLPYDLFLRSMGIPEQTEKNEKTNSIEAVQVGQRLYPMTSSVHEGVMTAPKHYTEDSLLAAMETAGVENMPEDTERKGLGTPATRAEILEKLVHAKLVERKGTGKHRLLIPTEKGKSLIAVMPDEITSALMTAEWEQRLKAIERGEENPESFMNAIHDMLRNMVSNAKPVSNMAQLFHGKYMRVGSCPVCGAPVADNPKGFFCENRLCGFAIWKDNRFFVEKGKEITREIVSTLLAFRRMDMKGLVSKKTGKQYDATVLLVINEKGKARFKLEFPEKKEKEV